VEVALQKKLLQEWILHLVEEEAEEVEVELTY
jgi:hypothetical protein